MSFKKATTGFILIILVVFTVLYLSRKHDTNSEDKAMELLAKLNFQQAVGYFKKAIDYHTANNNVLGKLHCKNLLVWCLINEREFAKAKKLVKENLGECLSKLGKLNKESAYAYYLKSLLHRYNLETDLALENINYAIDLYKLIYKKRARYNLEYNRAIALKGTIFCLNYAYNKSLEYLNISLKEIKRIFETKPSIYHFQELVNVYHNIANTYILSDNFEPVIPLYTGLLKEHPSLLNNTPLLYASVIYNLGASYSGINKQDSAIYYLKKTIGIYEKEYGSDYYLVAGAYSNLGFAYIQNKDYKNGIKCYEKSIKGRVKVYGKKHFNVVKSYIRLADAYFHNKDYNAALINYQKSIISNTLGFNKEGIKFNPTLNLEVLDPKDLLRSLTKKSTIFKIKPSQGNLEEAFKIYQICDTLLSKIKRLTRNKSDKIAHGKSLQKVSSQAVDIACQLSQFHPQKRRYYLDQAFYFAEQNKASVLSASLAEVDARKFAGIPDDLLEKEKKLRIDINFFKSRLLRNPGDKQQHYKSKLFDLNRAYETLIESLENNYKDYYALKYERKIVSLSELQRKLTPGKALLQYITGEDQSYVFVITQNKVHLQSLASADKLFKIVKKYYFNLQGGLKLNGFAQASYKAYQELFQPIEQYLRGIQKLTIIPDWQLAKLPFEALIRQMPGNQTNNYGDLDYLVTRFEINYHYSASIWYKKRTKSDSAKFAFIAFAPFSDSQGNITDKERFANELLPASGIEVETIDRMFKKKGKLTDVYFANRATKEIFQKQSPSAKIIHIASHSKYGRNDENRTQISFAGNDSLLVGSIYNLELKADLVVLSSCESGMGKSYKGEGMMSLSRSFLYAGARNIVFSYWRVKDNYTKDLMIDFYSGFINRGYTYAQALQAAKKTFIEKNKKLHPKLWSGFAIVGD